LLATDCNCFTLFIALDIYTIPKTGELNVAQTYMMEVKITTVDADGRAL